MENDDESGGKGGQVKVEGENTDGCVFGGVRGMGAVFRKGLVDGADFLAVAASQVHLGYGVAVIFRIAISWFDLPENKLGKYSSATQNVGKIETT